MYMYMYVYVCMRVKKNEIKIVKISTKLNLF